MDQLIIFIQICPKISFIHKMSKNKAYTWNEHLLSTQDENLQVKLAIL